jgi:CubicO group peptidase (beta-lactamase class C family)
MATMKRLQRAGFGLLALCMSISCAGSSAPPNRDIDAIIASNGATHGIPAQAVMVMRNGKVVYQHSAGTRSTAADGGVDADTVFPIFSVGKLFIATLIFEQVEAGTIDLDSPASRYVSGMPETWAGITVRQFLSQVSGVPDFFDPSDLAKPFPASRSAMFEQLRNVPLAEAPGTRSRYTLTNTVVLCAILEAVTGRPVADLVQQRLIDRLKLRNIWLDRADVPADRLVTSYHSERNVLVPDQRIDWPDYARAFSDVHATAGDLARFLDAVADGFFVRRSTLDQLWRPYAFANGNTGIFASAWEYGESGVWREVGHDGGAKLRVRILFRQDTPDRWTIVYLTNGSRDNVWSRTLLESVQHRMVGK